MPLGGNSSQTSARKAGLSTDALFHTLQAVPFYASTLLLQKQGLTAAHGDPPLPRQLAGPFADQARLSSTCLHKAYQDYGRVINMHNEKSKKLKQQVQTTGIYPDLTGSCLQAVGRQSMCRILAIR
jgi:hypothetical protein